MIEIIDDRDAALVHVLDRLRRRPVDVGGLQHLAPFDLGDPLWRREMMMHVDAVRLRRLAAPRLGRARCAKPERGQAATDERRDDQWRAGARSAATGAVVATMGECGA